RGWTSSTCKGRPSRSASERPTPRRAPASIICPDRSGRQGPQSRQMQRPGGGFEPPPGCFRGRLEAPVKIVVAAFAPVLYTLALGSAYAHGDHPSTHGG